jgi:aerobic-type carbon monoxide dehydrogenase small subunit (CoxS/CutS family)
MSRKKDKMAKPPGSSSVSRRDFLRGAGVAVSGGLIVGETVQAKAAAGATTPILGPGKVPITLRINGKPQKLELEPRVTLLDALRNHLDLTGAKKVCDRGVCGACTVILDGHPVYACNVLAIEAQGRNIQTIESLSVGGKLHPVSAAFVEHDAQQCGFCTPGFVMAVKAFLDHHPHPTMQSVEKGLGGNLCRCGTYVGIRKAALQAAKSVKGGLHNA